MLSVALVTSPIVAAGAIGCGHTTGLTYGGAATDGGEAGADAASDASHAAAPEAASPPAECCAWGGVPPDPPYVTLCPEDGGEVLVPGSGAGVQCYPTQCIAKSQSITVGTLSPCPVCAGVHKPGGGISPECDALGMIGQAAPYGVQTRVCVCPDGTTCQRPAGGGVECLADATDAGLAQCCTWQIGMSVGDIVTLCAADGGSVMDSVNSITCYPNAGCLEEGPIGNNTGTVSVCPVCQGVYMGASASSAQCDDAGVIVPLAGLPTGEQDTYTTECVCSAGTTCQQAGGGLECL